MLIKPSQYLLALGNNIRLDRSPVVGGKSFREEIPVLDRLNVSKLSAIPK